MLQAVVVGVVIPFGYDGLRILRRVLPHKSLAIAMEDFFFWVICGISVFLWMYRVRGGGLRWFAIAGALVGMSIYKGLFSEFLVTYTAKLLGVLLRVVGRFVYLLLYPLRILGREMRRTRIKMGNCRRKLCRNIKIWLKSGLKALTISLGKK